MLGGFSAEQCATRLPATFCDTGDHLLGDGHVELPAREVVQEKQRPRTGRDHVVDAHRHQIDADRVVLAHRAGQFDLRSDSVGSAHQQGVFDVFRQPAQPGKTAHVRDHLGDPCALRQRLDPLHQLVARVDVDARVAVGHAHRGGS
jgi:hypothetical protein